MKTLMPQRMESMIITMHSLQMKNQPIKLKDIASLMEWDERLTSNVLRELQSRELVIQVGKARKTIYHLTKKAEEALEQKVLAKLVNTNVVRQNQVTQHQNRLNPTHVGFMKQMNQFLKEHENLINENKSLQEENLVLKNKLDKIKNLFNI